MTYTVASHNMYHKLSSLPWKWDRDLKKSDKGTITVYCEAQKSRSALLKFCNQNGRDLYYPENDVGNPISWRKSAATYMTGWCFLVQKKGDNYTNSPARGFTAVGLRLTDSKRKVLILSVHAEHGYAKSEAATPWNDNIDSAKDWMATQYWLRVLSFVSEQMSLKYWDDIVIAGDFNSRMNNRTQWYYPGRLLDSVCRASLTAGGIDHVITTITSKSKVVGIMKLNGWTDHPILLARLS